MGKYDIGTTYQASYACTIADLCNEILDEAMEAMEFPKENETDLGRIRGKFSNIQGSGIVEKLDGIGFPVWEIAGTDEREKYAALQILKKFYYIEKDTLLLGKRVNITRILSNPCIDNLESKANNEAFQNLYQSILDQIENAPFYEHIMESIKQDWESLIRGLSRFIYCPNLISRYEEIGTSLERASSQLNAIEIESPVGSIDSKHNDGIMRTLLILLIRYKILASNNSVKQGDDDTLKLGSNYDKLLATGYLNKAKCGDVITWEQVDSIAKTLKMNASSLANYLETNGSESFFNFYIGAYSLGPVTNCDITSPVNKAHRANAFNYVKDVAMWIQSVHRNLDFSEGIPLHVLAGVVQSTYHVSKNRVQYSISAYGETKKRTLLAALKDGSAANKAARLNMENRVADRVLIMLGKQDMLDYYHRIRRILLEMENSVISYNSLSLIQKAHSAIFNQAQIICDGIR